MGTLINPENSWLVWMAVIIIAALAIVGEQKTKIGGKIGGVTIAVFGAMLLANINVLPFASQSPVYGSIGSYVLPLSIAMMLFSCDTKKIIKESGKLFFIFHIAAIGTIIGAIIMGFVFKGTDGIDGIVAMEVGAFIGSSANLVAAGEAFNADSSYIGAMSVAANLLATTVMVVMSQLSDTKWVRKNFNHPYIDAFEQNSKGDTGSISEQYWKPKNISLLSIVLTFATAFAICAVSSVISKWVVTLGLPNILTQLFGSIYLVISTITLLLVFLFPKFFSRLSGAQEFGTFGIMIFLVYIGAGADLKQIVEVGPTIFTSVIFVGLCNIALLCVVAKFAKWNWEEVVNAALASIGGPSTAAAVSINRGWSALAVPGLLVGLWGIAIGNYLAIIIGNIF